MDEYEQALNDKGLEFEEEIRFDIAKKWIFSKIVFDGIKL